MKKMFGIKKFGLMIVMGLIVGSSLLSCGVSKASDDNLPIIDPANISNDVMISYDKVNPSDLVNTKMIISAPDKTIMNFSSFNIGKDYIVDVKLPSLDNGALASFLARDVGGNVSYINGTLNCNGLFILTNTNGINISSSANINTSSLILSTRDITDTNFLSSQYIFEKQLDQQTDRLLLNKGTITISNGGFGVLIAGAVENQGVIVCPVGTIALAGGDSVRLDIAANGLLSIAIDKEVADTVYDYNGNPITSQINNSGRLEANGGTVILRAESLPGLFEKAINMTGYIKADRVENKDGLVKLISSGNIGITGEISATRIEIGQEATPPASVNMTDNAKLTAEESVKVASNRISVNADSPVTQIYKTQGDINIRNSEKLDNMIIIEGDGLKVTYMVTSDFTLRCEGAVDTSPGVILYGNSVTVIANKFGNAVTPLSIDAGKIHIQRTYGDINILESQGIGTSVLITGPPDGFGKIIYPNQSSLVLEAARISVSAGVILSSTSGSITLKSEKGDIDVFGTISAPEGDVTLWTCGNIDVRQAIIISKNGGFIYNPEDTISVSWVGGSGNSWATGANWSGGNVPNDANYIVTINLASAAVTTSAAYTIGALTIGGSTTSSLTLGGNLILDTSLGATGNLTISTGGTLSASSYTITVPGNWDSSAGTFTYGTSTVDLTGTGSVKTLNSISTGLFYNLKMAASGTPSITTTMLSSLGVMNTLTLGSGTLTDGASSFNLGLRRNGDIWYGGPAGVPQLDLSAGPTITINQIHIMPFSAGTYTVTVSGGNYGTITTGLQLMGNGSGTTTFNLSGNITVDGPVQLMGTSTLNTANYNIITTGTVTIPSNGILTANGSTITVGGNWTNSGTFTANTSTVTFTGNASANQTVTTNGQTFYNFTVNNDQGTYDDVIISGNLDVDGTLTVTDGELKLSTNNPNVNTAGAVSIGASGTVTKGTGTWTFDGTTAVTYTDSTATPQDIGVVAITKTSGTPSNNKVTLASSMTVDTLTISANNTLDLASAGWTLTLANAGATATVFTNSGTLTPGTSTVKYSATNSGGNINVVTTTYNSLQLSGAETYVLTGNLTTPNNLTGNLTIDANAILDTVSGSNYNIALAGNWSNSGTFTARSGTVTFTGNASANQTVTTNGQAFYNFTVNNDQGTYDDVIISGNLDVDGTLTVTDGELKLSTNNPNVNTAGAVSIGASGTVTKGTGTWTFDGTTAVTYTDSTATPQDIGVVAITKTSGTPSNNKVTLASSMTVDTLTISANNTLDLASAGYILTLANAGATATVFTNSGTLTPGTSTVKYSATNSGGNVNVVTTTYNSLQFSGAETYVLTGNLTTPNNLTGTLTIDLGAILDAVSGSNYNITLAGNWSNSGTFTANSGTVTFDGSGTQTITGANTWYNLTIANTYATPSDTYDVDPDSVQTVTGTLAVNDGQWTSYTGDDYNNVTIGANGIIRPDTLANITVSGNWTNNGTFTPALGTVTFDGSGTQILISGGTGNGKLFYNLTHSGSGTLQLSTNNLNVTALFTNSAGTFDTNDLSITVGGVLTVSGGTFTGSTGALDINGDVSITSGTLTAPSGSFTISGLWFKTGGTFTPGTYTVTFDGDDAQTITGATTWYNLTIANTYATPSDTYDVDPDSVQTVTGTLTVNDGQWTPYTGDDYNNVTIGANGILKPDAGANFTVSGNWSNSGTFTPNAGTLTFDGSGSITDSNTVKQDLGAVQISNSSTRTQATAVKMTSLTIGAGSTYDLADYDFTFSSAAAVSNSGALKLHGNETLTNVSGFGTSAGIVDYYGSTYASANIFTSYYTLTLSGTGTFIAPLDLTIYGDFNHTGGTFSHNNGTVTFAGTNQSITGNNTFYNITKTGTGVLTFPGNNTQTIRGLATFRGTGIGNLLTLNKDANGTRWNINITSDRYDFIYLDVYNSNNLGIIIYAPQSFVTGCIGWEGRARPVPIPTPTQNKVADATNENNIIMNDAVTEAKSILNMNDVRIERVQQRIISYIATLQKIMVPPSAIGLKVMFDGKRIYIAQ